MTQFIGVDPGIVHSGVVMFELVPFVRTYRMEFDLIDGLDTAKMAEFCARYPGAQTFIEAYRPRSHYDSDAKMGKAINDLRRLVPGSKTIDNTGAKQVVTTDLMKLFGVWLFPITTHHQDLRAAARIGLYGALKDAYMNTLIYGFVLDHLDGAPWTRA